MHDIDVRVGYYDADHRIVDGKVRYLAIVNLHDCAERSRWPRYKTLFRHVGIVPFDFLPVFWRIDADVHLF